MAYTVCADTKTFENIRASTLGYAVGIKFFLLAEMDISSTIEDDDGCVVSERKQYLCVYKALCCSPEVA